MTALTMSLDLEDPRLERNTTDKQSPSQASTSERQLTKFGLKNRTLRLDSPTTIEACKELGILVKELKQKSIDEFRDSKVDEEIINVRFSHYMKKYNQIIKEVWVRKRQITRGKKGTATAAAAPAQTARQSALNPPMLARTNSRTNTLIPAAPEPTVEKKDCIVIQTSPRSIFHNTTTNGIKLSASMGNLAIPTPLAANFNKTLMYFRNSHNTNDTKDFEDVVGNDVTGLVAYDESVEVFDNALAKEVSRFNKIKRQKQKEANDTFHEDIKRLQMMEEMKEREKKKLEREKKIQVERKKQDEERRSKAEEKLQKIRDLDLQFQSQKQEEKQKMQLKLEEVKKKIAEDTEERKRAMTEREEKLEEKRRVAEERRIRLKEEEQQRCDELKMHIEDKLVYSQEKHASNIVDRMARAQMQIQKIEESVKKTKEKQEQDDKEHIQKLVQKLVKKEENFKEFQMKHLRELKRKEKEAGTKSARFYSHQADLDMQRKERMNELTERFLKVQENLELKKEEDIKNLKLKQELNRLRIADKQENFQRKRRQIEYEQNKIIENEKYHQEKLAWLKSQKNIMQQARVEATIQSKIEKDRIEGAVQYLSKLTTEGKVNDEINEQQKRILKNILTPEDYRNIEKEEQRKKQAKAEAEAKKKAERNGQNFNMQRL